VLTWDEVIRLEPTHSGAAALGHRLTRLRRCLCPEILSSGLPSLRVIAANP